MSGGPAFETAALVPHPATPSRAAQSIVVRVRREPQALALCYVVTADLDRLRIPAARHPARVDGLWRHTCFELFVAAERPGAYQEFNFSPSGEWAAYGFADYRNGAGALACAPPPIALRRTESGLELDAAVACALRGRVRLGLCAVLEDAEGALSFWALRHPSPCPDFHDAGSFVLKVDGIRH
jgi:hypothetical protein